MSPGRKVLARYQACYRARSKSAHPETSNCVISDDLQVVLDVLAQLPNPPIVILVASSETTNDSERSFGPDDQPAPMLSLQKKPTERPSEDQVVHPLRVLDVDIVPAISLEVQLGFSAGWFQPALRALSACVTTCAARCLTAASQPRLPGAIDGAPRDLIRRGLRSLQKSLAMR